ncbi:DUF4142 domain-containing protein [Rhodopseudomonas sp. B29]|uniref:DUF4142 domain-containing protein n=1 Tax=Rhodopseudomonas sp. B29 TaxID=95607 RepID=UPI0003B74C78|nr:DUF4142 domain-containing protein [Rhodopseudomonas sp. B29]
MRWLGALVAVLPAFVILAGVLGNAETPRKHSLIEQLGLKTLVGWPPNGPDVLRELHQLDMVDMQLAGLVAGRGDDTMRRFAYEQAALAQQRDARIVKLNTFTGLGIDFPDTPTLVRTGRLAGLQGKVGRDFVDDYMAIERRELTQAIARLHRYLLGPDNEQIWAFARQQLKVLMQRLTELDELGKGEAVS